MEAQGEGGGVGAGQHSSWAHNTETPLFCTRSLKLSLPRVTLQTPLPNPDSSSGPSDSIVLERVPLRVLTGAPEGHPMVVLTVYVGGPHFTEGSEILS